jgi:SAM-dependent methyltransferase
MMDGVSVTEEFGPRARDDRSARRFARLWKYLDHVVDHEIRDAKAEVLADVPSRVVEIGPGRGANFHHYPAGTTVIAFEPNTYFHDPLVEAATEHGLDLELHVGDLRDAALPDASVDAVVATLVLCSVDDPPAMIAEIERILTTGGRFCFVEHVAAEPGTKMERFQRAIRRPCGWIGDGCDPHAQTVAHLAASGLDVSNARVERLGAPISPTARMHWGVATKP